MEIIKIVSVGIVGVMLILIIKQYRPEFAIYLSILVGILIMIFVIDKFKNILDILYNLANKSGVNSEYIAIILKLVGIAYLSEFGINICKDAGAIEIASKIELGGKIIMISLSIPVVLALVELITNVL